MRARVHYFIQQNPEQNSLQRALKSHQDSIMKKMQKKAQVYVVLLRKRNEPEITYEFQ